MIDFNQQSYDKTYYYTGEKVKIYFSSVPNDADKQATYTFRCSKNNEQESVKCSIDENGYFTYTGTILQTIIVTATSVHNPEAQDELTLIYRGIDPTDECVEEIRTEFYDEKGKLCDSQNLVVGKKHIMRTTLVIKDEYLEEYGLTKKELVVSGLPYHLYWNGEMREDLYQFDTVQRYLTFYKPCSGELTIKYRKGADYLYFDDIEGNAPINKQFSVTAVEDPDYVYKPTAPLKPNVGTYDEESGEYVVTVRPGTTACEVYGKSVGGTINAMCYLRYRDEESKKVASLSERTMLYRKVNKGVCNLDMVSVFDETLVTKVKVVFEGYTPTKMNVYIEKTLAVGAERTCKADFEHYLYGEGKVAWSIVEGADKVELNGSKLVVNHLGKIVLRAESVYYPDLVVDTEIELRLFTDSNMFVRKVLGHFLLFVLLGMGYFTCYFFFVKKRGLSFLLAPVSVLTMAILTEWIQSVTPGRGATIYDVLVNFSGGLFGIFFVALCFAVFMIIVKTFFKKTYQDVKTELPKMSLKTAFTRTRYEMNEWNGKNDSQNNEIKE